ncbi:MAG: toxin-antitoxin system, antitoxin component [Kangiella sp.]|nr:MAG: toxin-antitoxin system, antitoxin component [Kangiella sp.]PHS19885.1 MAG: toxin-antitoxin system, antitoxin component [Kangiella sp.]
MKKEYDFSQASKGKFYKKGADLHTPIYLEPELESYFSNLAKQKQQTVNEIVNLILNKEIELAKLVSI